MAGSNSCGQLGHPRSAMNCSREFQELPSTVNISVRSVALGQQHTLMLTFGGELYACGINNRGQCGTGASGDKEQAVEVPTLVVLPRMPGRTRALTVWAVSAGHNHNVVLCAAGSEPADPCASDGPSRPSSNTRTRHDLVRVQTTEGDFGPGHSGRRRVFHGPAPRRVGSMTDERPTSAGPFVVLRPMVQPGFAPRAFLSLSVAQVSALLHDAASSSSVQNELRRALTAAFARPSVLNSSFCYPGMRTTRLDAAGLCRMLAAVCSQVPGLGVQLLEAAAEGISILEEGHPEELTQRDQIRAVAIYLCIPAQRAPPPPGARAPRSMFSGVAHLVMRMSGRGRTTLRDLIADECGDVRVLRDFLVPHVRSVADEAIRNAGQQPWLSGPLWEVVAQLQLQRALWEAVLLLQVLASASEQAARLLNPVAAPGSQVTGAHSGACSEDSSGGFHDDEEGCGADNIANASPGEAGSGNDHERDGDRERDGGTAEGRRGREGRLSAGSSSISPGGAVFFPTVSLLESSAFQLASLAEGFIPPEVEFWLFQEHAQFRQITPTEVVEEYAWSDAAGMLPRRFCSFMAHANLVPVAFKQRVLQVENVLRQRLSQEQVLWPQAEMVLGGGRADPTAFYFMLTVSRQNLLRDTFAQMYGASPVDLRRPLRVEFAGEEAVDEGGVMREFFRLLSHELFAPDAGLFYEVEGSRRLWFSPRLGPGRQLQDYWMVGIIVALAVYNNHPGLDAPLPSALFKKLKEQPTTQDDLAQLFPAHSRSLEAVLHWTPSNPVDTEEGLKQADQEFSDTFCLSFCIATPSVEYKTGGSSNGSGSPEEADAAGNAGTAGAAAACAAESVKDSVDHATKERVEAPADAAAAGGDSGGTVSNASVKQAQAPGSGDDIDGDDGANNGGSEGKREGGDHNVAFGSGAGADDAGGSATAVVAAISVAVSSGGVAGASASGGSDCAAVEPASKEVPLCKGGLDRPVLFRDREQFAGLVHRHLLHTSVQPQFESFARGFRRVCNSSLFDVLSPEELEAIVAGDKDLDFAHLRRGVQYEGYSPNEVYIEGLWAVLESFSPPRRRRFLAFCTGSDVAPAGGLQDLHLLVQKHGVEPTMRLPVAHTCFNLLLLPKYSSLEKLRAMLITAIEWTEGFGLQ